MQDRIRVFAIDTDVAVLRQRTRILEDRHGFEVETAHSIPAAKEQFEADAQMIDCVLYHASAEQVDDALEFISWVSDRFPATPIVFSTDVSIDPMPGVAFEHGATAFVPTGKTTAPHNQLASRIRSLVTAKRQSESPEDGGFVWLGGDEMDSPTANDPIVGTTQDTEMGDNREIPAEALASIRRALTADSDLKRSKPLVAFLLLEYLSQVRDESIDDGQLATGKFPFDELESGYKRVVDRIANEGRHANDTHTEAAVMDSNRILQIIDEEFPKVTGNAFSALLGELLAVEQVDRDAVRKIASQTDDVPADHDDETNPLFALVRTSLGEMSADVPPDELSTESEVADEIEPAAATASINEPLGSEVAQSDGDLLGLVEAAFTDGPVTDQNNTTPTASPDNTDGPTVSESQFDTHPSDEVPIEASDSIPDDEDTPSSVPNFVSPTLTETDSATDGPRLLSADDEADIEAIEESALDEHDTETSEESVTEELKERPEIEAHPVLADLTVEISDDRLKELSRDELLSLVRKLADRDTQTGETDQTVSDRISEDETTVSTAPGGTTGDTVEADDSTESTSVVSTAEELRQPTNDPDQAIGTTQPQQTFDESASPDGDTQSTDPFDQFGSGQTEYDRPANLDLTPGDVVLVQCGSQDDRKQQACIDLLGVDDVADRNVLVVRYTEMNGPRLERIATHANRVTLVSVGYNQRVPQSVQQAIKTVNVTNPNDVTRLGIVMTATLDNWSARDGETVVCFDPLNVLLRYKNVENVFRFLHILFGKLRSGNAISHFHVDPTAGDPQEINTLKPLFDSVLAIDSVGVSVEH